VEPIVVFNGLTDGVTKTDLKAQPENDDTSVIVIPFGIFKDPLKLVEFKKALALIVVIPGLIVKFEPT